MIKIHNYLKKILDIIVIIVYIKYMKKGGGKNKGSEFERKICKALSAWYSDGEHDDLCWRSAGSGARGTTTKTKTAGYHGDICAISPLMEDFFNVFCIELKHYAEIDITEPLRALKCPRLFTFWKQTKRSAVHSNRHPLLIYKMNRRPEMIMMEKRLFDHAGLMKTRRVPFISLGLQLFIMNFWTLLEAVDRPRLRNWLSKGIIQECL